MTTPILVASRSGHKLREIREILAAIGGPEVIDPGGAGIAYDSGEEAIEVHETFVDNALAKARYFAGRSGLRTLADDSGLCVEALGGAPGVRSKRFSGRLDLSGEALDRANNELLLERLQGLAPERRAAYYVCVAALVGAEGQEVVVEGRCDGMILPEPRGERGFGYDPLFFLAEENATFGQLASERKNTISHRARAMRAIVEVLPG